MSELKLPFSPIISQHLFWNFPISCWKAKLNQQELPAGCTEALKAPAAQPEKVQTKERSTEVQKRLNKLKKQKKVKKRLLPKEPASSFSLLFWLFAVSLFSGFTLRGSQTWNPHIYNACKWVYLCPVQRKWQMSWALVRKNKSEKIQQCS